MKQEINFYQVEELTNKEIAPLLIKILDEGKKTFLLCQNQKKLEEINSGLWSYGRNKFIPHILDCDKGFDLKRQPILLSTEEKNLNEAEYLVLLGRSSLNFLKKFPRSFFFCESHNLDSAKEFLSEIKSSISNCNSYKKEDGKWIKFNLA